MDETNVLVIEDDLKAASWLEDVLKLAGYKVWLVDHPKRGLELAQRTTFAAALTELRFAGMNGVEVARAMAKLSPDTSVVVITAYAFISSAVEAMEAGAYGYITKPFNAAEARIVVQRAVERFALLSARAEKRQFAELSVTDALTGVYNRRYFKMRLAERLASKAGREMFSLLMVDLDDFKKYNDTEGHQAGDQILRQLCKVMKDCVRQNDLIFRYGGDEFIVLLDQKDKKGASVVAERIRTLVSLYMPATVSIGVSACPEDGADEETLVARADAPLYQAKQAGKNRVFFS